MGEVSVAQRAHAVYSPRFGGVEVFLFDYASDGRTRRLLSVGGEPVEMDPKMRAPHCSVALEEDAGRELIECLWNAGLRPSGAAATQGTAEALKAHIASLEAELVRVHALVDRQAVVLEACAMVNPPRLVHGVAPNGLSAAAIEAGIKAAYPQARPFVPPGPSAPPPANVASSAGGPVAHARG